MDTMEITKIVGGLCGSLLVFLLVQSGAEAVIHGGGGHGAHAEAYPIEVASAEEGADSEAPAEEEVPFEELYASADAAAGEGLFRACSSCHKLEDGANAVGPHLYGVVGREVDAVSGYSYSGALEEHADTWTPENLNAFLANPSGFAPGTKMSYRGMADAEDRANLIAYLDSIGG